MTDTSKMLTLDADALYERLEAQEKIAEEIAAEPSTAENELHLARLRIAKLETWREQERRHTESLEAQLAAAKKEVDTLTFAAHKPDDYRFGVASWINQRLYRTYIEQGKDPKHWDALTAALDARDKAEADAEAAEKKFKDEHELAEWLQKQCSQVVDDYEKAEADAARLREILRDVWNQFAIERPDGSKWAGGLSTLEDVEVALRHDEQPEDSDAGFVWPKNEVRHVKGKLGETRIRPPFVICDDDEQPAESEGE